MQMQNTSAANFPAMLTALYTFLTTNGWTGSHTPGSGTATLINSHGQTFALSTQQVARTDVFTGSLTDQYLRMTYDREIVGGTPGQSAQAIMNDMFGPFPNLWFFTDDAATFCHVVAQCSASRYSHGSFGTMDNKGIHAELLPYTAGTFWQFWATSTNITNTTGDGNPFNNPSSGTHLIPYLDAANNTKIGIPDGLLDPTLFFTDGPIIDSSLLNICDREYALTTGSNNSARFLDYFCCVENKTFTGGVVLSPLPAVSTAGTNDVRAYIGDFPGVALVNMQGLSPGQTLTFADEEWLVFPIKQTGTQEAAKFGSNPLPFPNSWRYGFAYKAVD